MDLEQAKSLQRMNALHRQNEIIQKLRNQVVELRKMLNDAERGTRELNMIADALMVKICTKYGEEKKPGIFSVTLERIDVATLLKEFECSSFNNPVDNTMTIQVRRKGTHDAGD